MKIFVRSNIDLDPDVATTQVFAFFGKRGSGKSYAAGVLVEQMLASGQQVVVIDVVGTWWGLRVPGVGPGFEIPVLGGDHGDIGILPEGGELVAEMLEDTGSSAVLDLSHLRKGQRQRFLTEWAEAFFHAKKTSRSPVHVVFEEAHTIIPQRVMKGQERMLGAMEDLVRLGRNYGIGATLIDQRPQSVHKDVVNQAEVLLVFQLTGAQERDAIKRWAEAKELQNVRDALADLSKLPAGEAILWSPEWLATIERVQVAKKQTADTSATPTGATPKGNVKKMRPIDLPRLEAAMIKVAEQVEGKKPSLRAGASGATTSSLPSPPTGEVGQMVRTIQEQKQKIAELEQMLARAATQIDVARTERDEWYAQVHQYRMEVTRTHTMLAPVVDAIGKVVDALINFGPTKSLRRDASTPTEVTAPSLRRGASASTAASTVTRRGDGVNGHLPPKHRAFLTALAQRGLLTKGQILTFTGYRPAGPVSQAFAALVREGCIEAAGGGMFQITALGRETLGDYEPLPIGEARYQAALNGPDLSTKEKRFLMYLWGQGTVGATKGDILRATGYRPAGPVSQAFARLVALGYATKAGHGRLMAHPDLYG